MTKSELKQYLADAFQRGQRAGRAETVRLLKEVAPLNGHLQDALDDDILKAEPASHRPPPKPPVPNFTGTITDSLGRKQYYLNGEHVRGPQSSPPKTVVDHPNQDHIYDHYGNRITGQELAHAKRSSAKAADLMHRVRDTLHAAKLKEYLSAAVEKLADDPKARQTARDVAGSHDEIRKLLDSGDPDRHKKIAGIIQGHTLGELRLLRARLGLEAPKGKKLEVIAAIAARAAGMPEKQGEVHEVVRRLTVDEAEDRVRTMLENNEHRTPDGVKEIARMLQHQLRVADIHQLKKRLGLQATGTKKELADAIALRASESQPRAEKVAAPEPAKPTPPPPPKPKSAWEGVRSNATGPTAEDRQREENALDHLERMQQWLADKPDSLAAQDAVERAHARVAAARAESDPVPSRYPQMDEWDDIASKEAFEAGLKRPPKVEEPEPEPEAKPESKPEPTGSWQEWDDAPASEPWFGQAAPPDDRAAHVQAIEKIGDVAHRMMPGLKMHYPGRNASFGDHLAALAGIDEHVQWLGVDGGDHFHELASYHNSTLDDLKEGKIDPRDALEMADSVRNGREADAGGHDVWKTQQALMNSGHITESQFYGSQFDKAMRLVADDIEQAAHAAAGGPPSAEKLADIRQQIVDLKRNSESSRVGTHEAEQLDKLEKDAEYHKLHLSEPSSGKEPLKGVRAKHQLLRDEHDRLKEEVRDTLASEKARAKTSAKKAEVDAKWRRFEESHDERGRELSKQAMEEISSHPEYKQEQELSKERLQQKRSEDDARSNAAKERQDAATWQKVQERGGADKVLAELEAELRKARGVHARASESNKWRYQSRIDSISRDINAVTELAKKFPKPVQPDQTVAEPEQATASQMPAAPSPTTTLPPGKTDPLSLRPDNVEAVWKHNQDAIVAMDPKMSPAMAGSLAAARILNGVGKRAADYIDAIDRRVKNGESISDEEDAKYIAAQDARSQLHHKLAQLSGYRPSQHADEHPLATAPIEFPGETTGGDRLTRALAHIDVKKAKDAHANVNMHIDDHVEKVRKAELTLFEAKEKLRFTGSRQPEKRQATKAVNEAQKRLNDVRQAHDDYYRRPETRKAELEGIAVDEKQPDFVRVAAANESRGKPAADDIRDMVRNHLEAGGHDTRITDAVAMEVSQYPMRAAKRLGELISGETTRQQMSDERKAARDFIPSLNLMPHHAAEAEREAGSLYAGSLDSFKERWTNRAEQHRAEQERQAKAKQEAEERQAKEQASQANADAYIAALRSGGDKPELDNAAAHKVIEHVLQQDHDWRSDGPPAPKGKNAKALTEHMKKETYGRYALAKTITEQGWATDSKQLVKATPAMVEHAKKLGLDQIEGRTPPVKDILSQSAKAAVYPAKVVATQINPQNGEHNTLVESEEGHQAVLDSQYLANIMGLYPDAKMKIAAGHSDKPVMFFSKGEPVGIIMPLSGHDKKYEYTSAPKLGLTDALEPGPYSVDDVEEMGGTLRVGRGDKQMILRVVGSKDGSVYLTHGGFASPNFPNTKAAIAAGKELLAHAHGLDEEGEIIFKPKGQGGASLEGDEKARRDYYANLREKVAAHRKVKAVKTENGDHYPVGEHFGVRKAVDDKGKPAGWDVVHLPTNLSVGNWTTKEAAVGHAHIVGEIPGADWGTLTDSKADPERTKRLGGLVGKATEAYENDELPEHAKRPPDDDTPQTAKAPTPEPTPPGQHGNTSKPDQLHGGRADSVPDAAIPAPAMAEGTQHEREHTSDPALAKEIAKDHLAEDPAYYDKLKQVEESAAPPLSLSDRIAAFVAKKPGVSVAAIGQHFGRLAHEVSPLLQELAASGAIERRGGQWHPASPKAATASAKPKFNPQMTAADWGDETPDEPASVADVLHAAGAAMRPAVGKETPEEREKRIRDLEAKYAADDNLKWDDEDDVIDAAANNADMPAQTPHDALRANNDRIAELESQLEPTHEPYMTLQRELRELRAQPFSNERNASIRKKESALKKVTAQRDAFEKQKAALHAENDQHVAAIRGSEPAKPHNSAEASEPSSVANDANIGRKWASPDGERQVIGIHPSGKYLVTNPMTPRNHRLMTAAELDKESSLDARRIEAAKPDPIKARHNGYVDEFAKTASPRMMAELSKRNNFGKYRDETVQEGIERMVRDEGYRVVLTATGPALVNNESQGFGKNALGASGMAFATFLSGKYSEESNASPAGPQSSDDPELANHLEAIRAEKAPKLAAAQERLRDAERNLSELQSKPKPPKERTYDRTVAEREINRAMAEVKTATEQVRYNSPNTSDIVLAKKRLQQSPPHNPALNPILAEHASAPPRAKDAIESALYNAGVEDPANPPSTHDAKMLARRLASEHQQLAERGGTPDELAAVERAAIHAGLTKVHEPGQTMPFDPVIHASDEGISEGMPVTVKHAGWRHDSDGETPLVRPKVEKVKMQPTKPIAVGDSVTYTGRGADPEDAVEFRGYHNSAETGEKMARVIFRPKMGPPYEMSVKVGDIAAKPVAPPSSLPADIAPEHAPIVAAINAAGGPDELTVDSIEQIRRDLYSQFPGKSLTPKLVRDIAEKMRQAVDVSAPQEWSDAPKPETTPTNNADVPAAPVDGPNVSHDDIPFDVARRAHEGTSFSPDDRGRYRQRQYVEQMQSDWDHLKRFAGNDAHKLELLRQEFDRYKQGFREKYLAHLHAQSRVMSPMITGPARFPVSSNRKKIDSADNRMRETLEFRERALKAIRKKLRPEDGPIKSSDPGAVDALQAQLNAAQTRQETMKRANEVVRQHAKFTPGGFDKHGTYIGGKTEFKPGKSRDTLAASLKELGLSDAKVSELLKPNHAGRLGFESFELTNNNANIARIQGRIKEVSQLRETPHSETQYSGGVTVIENPDIARIQVMFPGKPERATIDRLKASGFRWSPTEGAWQRHLNNGGRYATEQLLTGLGHTKTSSQPATQDENDDLPTAIVQDPEEEAKPA